jgi:hypothetical protein
VFSGLGRRSHSGFSVRPPTDSVHSSVGEGLFNACGAVTGRGHSLSRLPSAAVGELGEPTADLLPFLVDVLVMAAIEVDSTMDEYMATIGFADPDRSYPLPYEDQNYELGITSSLDEVESADPMDLTAILKVLSATDGGSQCNTTDRADLLWNLTELTKSKITLRAADKFPHVPSHVGGICEPDDSAYIGHDFIRTYLTPTLPATIVSPSVMSKQLRCTGYTSVSRFDRGHCSLALHNCKRSSEDATFPLNNGSGPALHWLF